MHVERQTIEMYKTIRLSCFSSPWKMHDGIPNDDGFSPELKIFAIVLGIGYVIAGVVFILELLASIVTQKWRIVFENL